jgi:hypothetical protein
MRKRIIKSILEWFKIFSVINHIFNSSTGVKRPISAQLNPDLPTNSRVVVAFAPTSPKDFRADIVLLIRPSAPFGVRIAAPVRFALRLLLLLRPFRHF